VWAGAVGWATRLQGHLGQAKRVVSVAKPILFDGSHLLVEAFQAFPHTGKTKIKCSGVSEKFSPMAESFQVACARALAEELHFEVPFLSCRRHQSVCLWSVYDLPSGCAQVNGDDDFSESQLVKIEAASQKFSGLVIRVLFTCWFCVFVCSLREDPSALLISCTASVWPRGASSWAC
jgi:hypothetical protein